MIVKVQKKDLFKTYLEWLSPVIKITTKEREVLAALISLHYTYRHYQDTNILNELLFSESTLKELCTRLKQNPDKFDLCIKSLEAKDLIQSDGLNKKINPLLTQYPKDNKFKIHVEFSTD